MRSQDAIRQVKQVLSEPIEFAPAALTAAIRNATSLVNGLKQVDLNELGETKRAEVAASIATADEQIAALKAEVAQRTIPVRFKQVSDNRLTEILTDLQSEKARVMGNAGLRAEVKAVKEATYADVSDADLLDRMLEADGYTPAYLAGEDIESPKELLQQTAETLRAVEGHVKAFADPIRAAVIDDLILGLERDAADVDWSEFQAGQFVFTNEQEQSELATHADADDPDAEEKVALYREQQFQRHKAVESQRRKLEAEQQKQHMLRWPRSRLIEKLVTAELESMANAIGQRWYLDTMVIEMAYGCDRDDPTDPEAAWTPTFQAYDEPAEGGGLRTVSPREQVERLASEPAKSFECEFYQWLVARCLERMSDRAMLIARSLQFQPALVTQPR